jgi:hypothetical protein
MNIGFQLNVGIRKKDVNKRPSLHRLHGRGVDDSYISHSTIVGS